MRKIKNISVIIVLAIVLSGCTHTVDVEQGMSKKDSVEINESAEIDEQGENMMEEKLLTKEEFIQAIQENDMGVTVEDFAEVDMEEFISEVHITKEIMEEFISGDLILSGFLESYIRLAPYEEQKKQLDPYLVKELKYVESTDEEYQAFIDSYFEALKKNAEYLRTDEDGADVYRVESYNDNSSINFSFCQTSKSKDLPLEYFGPDAGTDLNEKYMIVRTVEEGMTHNLDIYYSKSGKYLMYFDGRYEFETYEEWLHIIKTFCELED